MTHRIGIICNRLAAGGGMESHALSIISGLLQAGYQPVIFTKNHRPLSSDLLNKCEIYSFATKFVPRLLEDYLFSAWLRHAKHRAKITTCIGFCRNSESDILFCGGTHRGYSSLRKNHIIYDRIINRFEDRAYYRAKFILPASTLISKELETLHHVDSKKLVIAYPPFPANQFTRFSDAERLKARQDLGLDPNKTVLLFPSASGHERKGLPFILDCLRGFNNIQLAVAGKPSRTHNTSVVVIGYQTDMTKVYNAADYTILASSYEPFGMVAIESILCGTPVILAENIGCVEVISKSACQTFSRESPETLRRILSSLKPGQNTSARDINYDYSLDSQIRMLVSLLGKIHYTKTEQ